MPIYPLAPAHAYDETLAMVWETYQRTLGDLPAQDQIVMGDSAGGGLSLFVAQRIKHRCRPQPRRLVLFAPWLDLTTTDPASPSASRTTRSSAGRGCGRPPGSTPTGSISAIRR